MTTNTKLRDFNGTGPPELAPENDSIVPTAASAPYGYGTSTALITQAETVNIADPQENIPFYPFLYLFDVIGKVRIWSDGHVQMGENQAYFASQARVEGGEMPGSNTHVYLHSWITGNDLDNTIVGYDKITVLNRDGSVKGIYEHDDVIDAGAGNDKVYGCAGNDTLIGRAGNDMLYGGTGYDTLYGGADDDWLHTGPTGENQGAVMYGGTGNDSFVLGSPAPNAPPAEPEGAVWSVLDGFLAVAGLASPMVKIGHTVTKFVGTLMNAFGTDKGQVATANTGPSVIKDFNPLEDRIIVPIADIDDIRWYVSDKHNKNVALVIEDRQGNVLLEISFADAETIFGPGGTLGPKEIGVFVEQLMGSAVYISKDGALFGSNGQHKLDIDARDLEGLGNNAFAIFGALGNQEFFGAAETGDTVYGTNYGDLISGYEHYGNVFHPELAGDDILKGFDGDDLFFGGAGANRIYGGDGEDTASYAHAFNGIIADLAAVQTNTNGDFTAVWNGFAAPGDYDPQNDHLSGWDWLYSVEHIVGSDHNDVIYGDAGDNRITTGLGDDQLMGRGGNDAFVLTGGTNTILDFTKGEDELLISLNDYGLFGLNKTPNLIVENGPGGARIVNADTDDVIAIVAGVSAENMNGQVRVTDPNGQSYIHQGDVANGGSDGDMIISSHGTIHGHDGDDIIVATGGSATLRGGTGNDILIGGTSGFSYLYGGEDDDWLFAKAGGTTMMRGEGGDNHYVITEGARAVVYFGEGDTLYVDWAAYGIDPKDVSFIETGPSWGRYYEVKDQSGNLLFSVYPQGGAKLTMDEIRTWTDDMWSKMWESRTPVPEDSTNALDADLGNDDSTYTGLEIDGFDDLIVGSGGDDDIGGTQGDDFLVAGAGNDVMNGGAGADTYVFDAGMNTAFVSVDDGDRVFISKSVYGVSSLDDITLTDAFDPRFGSIVQLWNDDDELIGQLAGSDVPRSRDWMNDGIQLY